MRTPADAGSALIHAATRASASRWRTLGGCLALIAATACATSQPPHDTPSATRIVVISDLNSAYGSTEYGPEVGHAVTLITQRWRPDLVLIAGDMVAGQSPQLSDSVVRAMWSAFDATVAAPLRAARIPLLAAMGNHDASAYPAHLRDRSLAVEYWRSAGNAARSTFIDREHYPLRYTVRHDDVFIVVWDATNQESSRNDGLLEWLQRSLSSAAARAARHRIVLGHLPLYGIAEGRSRAGEVLADGDALRVRLQEWGATAFVSGHHHAWYPGRRGDLELLHSGALGDGPRVLLGTTDASPRTVTLLELSADTVGITGYAISPDGSIAAVDVGSLPRVICGFGGYVVRRDVTSFDHCDDGRQQ